jgi:UDP-N-acetylmuramoyl-tripeptide--D-alanyl-D-alanine ligase
VRVELSLLGRHQVHNALAAIAVCRRLGLDMQTVAERLAGFRGVPLRMELINIGGVAVINDAYNANPGSMAAALQAFERLRTSRAKHFVCGDMLEQGEASEKLHRELGERIAASDVDRLWLLGTEVSATRDAAIEAGMDEKAVGLTDSFETLAKAILKEVADGDVMLLKGSRGMKLERVVDALRGSRENPADEGA